ncbi:6-aminohexanoate hydrolase [Rhodoferax lacus]|uniref:6-aminohexanoate hydrolase n=1 Tax=Rhodoferax lacus TaxID=2184758 RepID=A0A3E1R712_9BURK|nr:6-aminohexanoate hydrolase [Rhodoferax lacus]
MRLIAALTLALAGATHAQTSPAQPSPALDPALLMQGFPPPPAYQIHIGNWQHYPQKIWSFQHMRELFPTRPLQAVGPVRALPVALQALDTLQVGTAEAPQTWPQMLAATHVDAALVLHHGRIVEERYFNGMKPSTPHLLFSATKSMAGLMAAVAVAEGRLDANARVDSVLPELADSAWAAATVRQVLDMTDGVQFSEVYTDPRSDIFSYIGAMGWAPDLQDPKKPRGIQAMLGTLKNVHPEPRGSAFRYHSPATDVTAWLAARATGMSLTAWMQQRLWSQLGMEHDGNVLLDPAGTEVSFAGLSASTRDFARIGQMLLQKGRVGTAQVIPAAVVDELTQGGDPKAFETAGMPLRKGWSYRSQWWVNPNAPRSFAAMGAFGQRLFVLPDDDMVVVLVGSHPQPVASLVDAPQFRAIQMLTAHLKGK